MNDLRDAYQPPSATSSIASTPSSRDRALKISVLTDENKALKEKYAELLKKTMLIIDKYKTVLAENEKFKIKKDKREYWDKTLSGLLEGIDNIKKKIILWFTT